MQHLCASVYCRNWWKVCLQRTAAAPETSYKKQCPYWDKTCVSTAHHTAPLTHVSVCSPSAHTRPVKPADRQCWPFAECPKLPTVCSNILWVSVYGRAVCKLIVLSSEGRKQGKKDRHIKFTTTVNIKATPIPCDPLMLGTGVPAYRRNLQHSPSKYPEEVGSAFPLTPPTCLPYS